MFILMIFYLYFLISSPPPHTQTLFCLCSHELGKLSMFFFNDLQEEWTDSQYNFIDCPMVHSSSMAAVALLWDLLCLYFYLKQKADHWKEWMRYLILKDSGQ